MKRSLIKCGSWKIPGTTFLLALALLSKCLLPHYSTQSQMPSTRATPAGGGQLDERPGHRGPGDWLKGVGRLAETIASYRGRFQSPSGKAT